jgi:hypothetical protein
VCPLVAFALMRRGGCRSCGCGLRLFSTAGSAGRLHRASTCATCPTRPPCARFLLSVVCSGVALLVWVYSCDGRECGTQSAAALCSCAPLCDEPRLPSATRAARPRPNCCAHRRDRCVCTPLSAVDLHIAGLIRRPGEHPSAGSAGRCHSCTGGGGGSATHKIGHWLPRACMPEGGIDIRVHGLSLVLFASNLQDFDGTPVHAAYYVVSHGGRYRGL